MAFEGKGNIYNLIRQLDEKDSNTSKGMRKI